MTAIIVHGGAGDLPDDRVADHIEGCRRAARAGWALLAAGGTALDATEAAVRALEDDPLFNAGTGACLDEAGEIELDACIMDGTGLRVGAVAALPPFREPIAIARRVLEDGRHALYAGEGAARFAVANGFERCSSADLTTDAARARWQHVRAGRARDPNWSGGTVGAVAIDAAGHVAAATSTGGLTNKRLGRVGDSAIPGAGNVADDEAGAASATGTGEPILRVGLGHVVLARLRMGLGAEQAAREALVELTRRTGGRAGVIVVDRAGRVGHAKSTPTLTWASLVDGDEDAGA